MSGSIATIYVFYCLYFGSDANRNGVMYARSLDTIFLMSKCVARLRLLPFHGGSVWCDMAAPT
jgi:hypothetical protein